MTFRSLPMTMRFAFAWITAFILANLAYGQPPADRFYQDFRLHADLLPPLTFFGPDPDAVTQFEKAGLRITFPPRRKIPERVGVEWREALKGDFELTARYAILQMKRPTDGTGVGVELFLATDAPSEVHLGLFRAARINEGDVYLVSRSPIEDGKRKYHLQHFPTETKAGRLKITRVGAEAILSAAEENSDDFQELSREPIGTDDLTLVRLNAYPGHTQNALDVRLLELRIRSINSKGIAALPAAVPMDNRAKDAGGKRWWPIVLVLGVLTTIGILVGVLLLRRGIRAERSPDGKQTPGYVMFCCPGCGKKLKTKSSVAGKNLKCPECGVAVPAPNANSDVE